MQQFSLRVFRIAKRRTEAVDAIYCPTAGRMKNRFKFIPLAFLAISSGTAANTSPDTAPASFQSLPAALVDVGIEEHPGDPVPLGTRFRDENDNPVKLSRYVNGAKPVLFNFAYFHCPMLCNLVLSGMVDGIKGLGWTPGKEFEVVTISMDSKDKPEQAAAKKATHIAALDRPGSVQGWHFLTGDEDQIRSVAKALGFEYHYNPATDDFSHAAVIFALSPHGKICRYLYGVQYSPNDLRLALLEAKDEKALSLGDKLLLFCYHYDSNVKGYVLFAQNLMRAGGYLVLAVMIGLLGGLWLREIRKRKEVQAGR
jgi:protein SCO1/2